MATATNAIPSAATAPVKTTPVQAPVAAASKVPTRRRTAAKKAAVATGTKPATKAKTAVPKVAVAPVKPGAATSKPATPVAASLEPGKEKKPKLIRDGFTIPKAEYVVLAELKLRAAGLQFPVKKSELVRAGIKALAAMSEQAFLAAVRSVPLIKTGRPSKD